MGFYTIPFGFSLSRNIRVNIFYLGNHFVWRRITDEGSLPEMRIWSILLIKSELKWCIHLSKVSFLIFQLLGECHCWWTSESPRAHVAKFYGGLRLIRSVLRASKFSVLKLIEIVILWDFYTIPFGFSLFRNFRVNIFYFGHHFVWRRITDEGSLPKMRIWSILLIKSEIKWCIHLSKVSFYISTTWWVSLLVDQWIPEGTCSQVLRSTSVD